MKPRQPRLPILDDCWYCIRELAQRTSLSEISIKAATQRLSGNVLRCRKIYGPSGRYVTRHIRGKDMREWMDAEPTEAEKPCTKQRVKDYSQESKYVRTT